MAYWDFKHLTRRTTTDKTLHDKEFKITKNAKYGQYKRSLASMVYKIFDKKTAGGAATLENKSAVKNRNISNKEIAEQLHKPITR